jgi:Zn2+/Cd2+-exporting ATPase
MGGMDTPPEQFRITGMDCADCARTIERGVAQLPGVTVCALHFGAATLRVQGAPREAVIARVEALGFGVERDASTADGARMPWHAQIGGALPTTGVLGFVRFLLQRPGTALALLGALLVLPSLLWVEILPAWTGVETVSPVFDALSLAALIGRADCTQRVARAHDQP